MSDPANPLDKFVTYTYHYQLMVSNSTEDGLNYQWNKQTSTQPTAGVKTGNCVLLINSYKDASPSIEELQYHVAFTGDDVMPLCPKAGITIKIVDTGGTYFYEKIYKALTSLNYTGTGGFWYLKVDFVGRLPDNSYETVDGGLMQMVPTGIESSFDFKGAEYHFTFDAIAFGSTKNDQTVSRIGKNLCIKGKSIGEAFLDFEAKLNLSIRENVSSKKTGESLDKTANIVQYKFDPGKFGNYAINSVIKHETLNQNDTPISERSSPKNNGQYVYINFEPNVSIASALDSILQLSPDFNTYVAQNRSAVFKTGHGGAHLYKIVDSVSSNSIGTTYTFAITEYVGRKPSDADYIYYYYYTGKNTDVINFDMKMNKASGFYILAHERSLDTFTNQTGTVSKPAISNENDDTKDVIDRKKNESSNGQIMKRSDPIGNPIYLKGVDFNAGHLQAENDNKVLREARETIAAAAGVATGTQFNAKIRGNPTFLLFSPTGANRLGFSTPLMVKMIIKNADGSDFWYKGSYMINTITNSFSGGIFTQDLQGCAYTES